MTFVEIKEKVAADLRAVAEALEKRASQIEEGDLSVMDRLLDDEWKLWYEMLLIRFTYTQEQLEESRNSEEG